MAMILVEGVGFDQKVGELCFWHHSRGDCMRGTGKVLESSNQYF